MIGAFCKFIISGGDQPHRTRVWDGAADTVGSLGEKFSTEVDLFENSRLQGQRRAPAGVTRQRATIRKLIEVN